MSTKISRNELCPCGSGKKYKNCCMDKENEIKKEVLEDNKVSKASIGSMLQAVAALHSLELEHNPYIKEYKRLRSLHREVLGDMLEYFSEGKFKLEVTSIQNINII
ncbi:MAG: SEC-C domain-containing protein [Oscillospiraceae bacterium]|nr:SEC-C domain-containing protein [Oscillospiraceae bacterium]